MDTPRIKLCRRCNLDLPIDNFAFHDNAKKLRRQSYCRACSTLNVADWRQANPVKVQLSNEKQRGRYKSRQGVAEEQYGLMLDQQNGVCAGCLSPPVSKRLAIDHNHITGQIRGLLCSNCNLGIGLLKEDSEIMARLIQYLAIRR